MDATALASENERLRTQLAEQAGLLKQMDARIQTALSMTEKGSAMASKAKALGESALAATGAAETARAVAYSGLGDGAVASLDKTQALSVVIFGATGDLAKKKLFPALYQLMLLDLLPRHVNIVGYGRRAVVMEEFLGSQCSKVKEDARLPKAEFLSRISFHAGGYDEADSYVRLDSELKEYEASVGGKGGNRLFFLSIPPTIFGAVCTEIGKSARAGDGFTHLIIEKPFGRDSASFEELNSCTSALFDESQLFRIDHYLGKEIVLNIANLRFANQMFEPSWNNKFIESVELTFKEDLGTGGRGGYFDKFGIIRDIMQNHLLQVFMFVAMEPPSSLSGPGVAKAKVELLKAVSDLTLEQGAFLGQFKANTWNMSGDEHKETGYLDDETVPEGSRCPTFASVALQVDNPRWKGVPFLMKAGKGLDERMAEVRVKFKVQPYNALLQSQMQGNELVMRIQPDEAVYMKTLSKLPGLEQVLTPTVMDMPYATQFQGAYVGDAYERMFLNAAKGDGSNFVGADELVEAWRIFTPLLHQIEETKPEVVSYPFGTRNPAGYAAWSASKGVTQSLNWQEHLASLAGDSAALEALFASMDADGSGKLTAAKVGDLAKQFYDHRVPTTKKLNEIIYRLDTTGDGHVTLKEWVQGAAKLRSSLEL